jgi:L-aminopeptidase/D-esterase-like protein
MMTTNAITLIDGIRVGHAQDTEAITGCTVVLCEDGAVGGIDQRGGAPGTRETDALHPVHLVDKVHAVMLAGGSAFGLDAAGGAMRYLEEKGVGFNVGVARVPIVPSAILFDLGIGDPQRRPDAAMGYQACLNASADAPAEGSVGAGTGATVGKILGMGQATKGGIGSAGAEIGGGVQVGALIAVNAFGDVIDPANGAILAGARPLAKGPLKLGSGQWADTLELMRGLAGRTILEFAQRGNTVIGVVATNAKFNKEESNKVARMAMNGLARTIRPANTMLDGDTLFALATGKKKADVNIVGAFAAELVAEAVLRAVSQASGMGGIPAAHEVNQETK